MEKKFKKKKIIWFLNKGGIFTNLNFFNSNAF